METKLVAEVFDACPVQTTLVQPGSGLYFMTTQGHAVEESGTIFRLRKCFPVSGS